MDFGNDPIGIIESIRMSTNFLEMTNQKNE